jgi:hypothetical protein
VADSVVLWLMYNGNGILLHTQIHKSIVCWRKSVSVRHEAGLFSDWSFV